MADPAPNESLHIVITDEDETIHVDPETGTVEEKQPDGGIVVRLDARRPKADDKPDEDDFFRNIVEDIDRMRLAQIAEELMEEIQADDNSRQESLQNIARGLDLLGIKLEEPRATAGDATAAVEGMSSVTNPLLLEAVLKGWANAHAELLPASGPVKIRDDVNTLVGDDELAEALERDMNHYLTKTAKEYYPDTSHMLLWGTYFGGSGFKKVYRCPLRRRPVSESVGMKDLIVSDTAKDFGSCGRITHQIPMRPSIMKRMQLIGAYRDVTLTQPTPAISIVDSKIAMIQGVNPTRDRPEDQPYTVWESQCELDLSEFAPSKFKDEGLRLPFLVSIDKDSREILAVRRDWEEEDEDCLRKRMYIKYPYVPGPGFYGTGMLGILGNSSAAMTAAWREALDAGMFASFPGGLVSKQGNRQNSSIFRVSPGEFQPVETNSLPIQQSVMAMPYRDVTPGLMGMIDRVTKQAQQVGGTADMPAGEGLQNIPVGTMLANIEQATKIMAAAHKGMHTAQSDEIDLILDLFRVNPEDFWRQNKDCPRDYWNEQKFLQAVDNCRLVPVSDPNVPSHIHRVAKALGLVQLAGLPMFQSLLDMKELLLRVLRAMREDPQGLVLDPQPQAVAPPPLGEQAKMLQAVTGAKKLETEAAKTAATGQQKMAEIAGKKDLATADIAKELIIHQGDLAHEQRIASRQDAVADRSHALDVSKHGLDIGTAAHDATIRAQETLLAAQAQQQQPKKDGGSAE